jgi:formate hydrogenlyase subunit 3/multisubunit Na+/H+ antiporter MnhD subunit
LQGQPPLFAERSVVWPMGLVLGAGLALIAPILIRDATQQSVVLLTIAHTGQLLFGLCLTVAGALSGVVLGILSQVLAVLLLMVGTGVLAMPGKSSNIRVRAMAGASLLVGLLVLLGVPPFGAWIGQALILRAAWVRGALTFVVMLLSLLLLAFAVVRLMRRSALVAGRPAQPPERVVLEPNAESSLATGGEAYASPVAMLALRIGTGVLILIVLAIGLWPDALLNHAFMAVGGIP